MSYRFMCIAFVLHILVSSCVPNYATDPYYQFEGVSIEQLGRCTAGELGVVAVVPPTGGDAAFPSLANLQIQKGENGHSVVITGSVIQDSNLSKKAFVSGHRIFYSVMRCDIEATAGSTWTLLTNENNFFTGLTPENPHVFNFTDTLPTGVTSSYIYAVVAHTYRSPVASAGNASFFQGSLFWMLGEKSPSTKPTEPIWDDLSLVQISGTSSDLSFSKPEARIVSFKPVQQLAIKATNSFGGDAITTGLNTVSAGYTLSATIDATLVSNPVYTWTSDTNLPDGMTWSPNGATLTLGGKFEKPGVYPLTVSVRLPSAPSHGLQTVSLSQTFVVTPQQLEFVTSEDLGSVQTGTVFTKDLVTAFGMSGYDSNKYKVNFSVTGEGYSIVDGNKINFDANGKTLSQEYSATVTASEACITVEGCPTELLRTAQRKFTVKVVNEFTFAKDVLNWAAGFAADRTNLNNYAQIRHGAGVGSVNIGLSGAGSTVAVTYTISGGATAASATAASQPVTSLSQLGLVFTSSTPSTIAESSVGSSTAMTGATFVLTIGASSDGANPSHIQTTVAFILLDGSRPTVVATPVFDAFDWGVAGKSQFLPTSVTQTLRVTYSKALTEAPVAKVKFSNGVVVNGAVVNGAPSIGNPANEVSYSLNFSDLSTEVAPSTLNNSLAVSEISFDASGRDTQPQALQSFRNETVTTAYSISNQLQLLPSYFVTNPLKVISSTSLGTVSAVTNLVISLNKKATVASAAVIGNLGAMIVNSIDSTTGTSLQIRPVTRFTYDGSGLITLNSTLITDNDGLPLLDSNNKAMNTSIAVTIESDTYGPQLLSAVQRKSLDNSLAVTFTAVFDESLSQCAFSPATGTDQKSCTVVNENQAVVELFGLPENRRYNFVIEVKDSSPVSNTSTVTVNYATLSTEDVAAAGTAPVNDAPPFVLSLTPDLRDASASAAIGLFPVFQIQFSESVTGGSLKLFYEENSTTSHEIQTSTTGTGNFRSIRSMTQLTATTAYRLEVSGFKGSNGEMNPVTYSFSTVAQSKVFDAPVFTGSPVTNQVVARDSSLLFFFSEPLNTDSLATGFTLTATGETVAGQWVVSGRSHTFSPSVKLSADTSYTYRFSNQVRSLNGVALASDVSGTFNTLAANAPSMFAVNVNSSGTGYIVTAAWLPGEETEGSYRLSVRKAAGTSFSGSATEPLTTIAVAAGVAKVTTSNTFTATLGQNAEFILETLDTNNTVIATSRANVYFLPAQNDVVTVPVSVTSGKVTTIAVAPTGTSTVPPVQVKIDPSALKTSANIQVQTVSDASTLNALPGGGKKVADVAQFGPDGTKFLSPVEIGMRFDPTKIGGGSAAVLMGKVNPVVFQPENQRWSSMGLGKSRVEIIKEAEAVLYFLTNHFSVFSVGAALLFETAKGQLSVENGQSEVRWSAPVDDADVTLTVSGSASGVTTQAIRQDGSSQAMIGIRFVLPNPVTQTINTTYTISLNDSGTTTSAEYILFREATGGSTTFSGTPRNVDTFTAVQSGASTAQLTWTITSDVTDLQINSVVVEVAKRMVASSGAVSFETRGSFSMNRAVLTTSITGLDAGATYRFKAYTTSFLGNRSAASGDIERFTYGAVLAGLPVGSQTLDTLNVVVTGAQVFAKRFSAFELFDVTGTGAILSSTTVLSNGATLLQTGLQTGLFDFSFIKASSVVITLPGEFSRYVMYHYDAELNSGAGAWELLQTPALAPNAQLNATIATAGGNTTVTIASKGIAGSPFALAIPPVSTTSSSSGGCLSIAGVSGNPLHGALNFLLMLFPVGMLWFRRNRQ